MAGIKLTQFSGIAPKVAPELLPDTAAQVARNCKFYSGNLIPYPEVAAVGGTGRVGTLETLFVLRDPDTQEKKWLSWTTGVDIVVVASETDEDEQRFYYTGDGKPKVSNYALATTGAAPYPVGYYDLGLPVPPDADKLNTSYVEFALKSSVSIARDESNIATLVTSTPHGLDTGDVISVSGFSFKAGSYTQPNDSYTVTVTINGHGLTTGVSVALDFVSGLGAVYHDGSYVVSVTNANVFTIQVTSWEASSGSVRMDIAGFNASNVECTVVNDTTLKYYSPGTVFNTLSDTNGRVNIGGVYQTRSYVYTWYTPWEEESIASKPSDDIYIREGTVVTVSNIPTAKPAGNNFIRGVRVYRTLPSVTDTEYFLLRTLWFPTAVTQVSRTANVSRVKLQYPHNLDLDERFKISGCTDASFNITGGVVTDLVDDYTFEYAQVAGDVAPTTVAAGTLYHDVCEDPPVDAARYWGDGGVYTFTDDFDSKYLLDSLETDNYDAPPDDLQGLTAIQNGIFCGFVGNKLYFSEPERPHAWPPEYARYLQHNIVGIVTVAGSAFVVTDSYPYVVSGADPANGMSISRVDANYPCLSKRSLVATEYGAVYSTHDGLAVYSVGGGPAIITKMLYNTDTWKVSIDPAEVVATAYGTAYLASTSSVAFVFEYDSQTGGTFTNCDFVFAAAWYDSIDGYVYATSGLVGDVYKWNDLTQPASVLEWKSKQFLLKDYLNFGAARVIADYANVTDTWEDIEDTWETYAAQWDASRGVTFRLWAGGQLKAERALASGEIFRLPTGYRSDTYEVGVESDVRVRAIHIAETPLGLKEV